jgi:hypothetical protein
MNDEQLAKIRNKAMTMYTLLLQNPTTEPAAFGVASKLIQDDAKCDLIAAILLLRYWIEHNGTQH